MKRDRLQKNESRRIADIFRSPPINSFLAQPIRISVKYRTQVALVRLLNNSKKRTGYGYIRSDLTERNVFGKIGLYTVVDFIEPI